MLNPLDPQTEYNVPKGDSKYLKFAKGETKFIPMASAVVGWQYWTNDNKPERLTEAPKNAATLPNIRQEDDGSYNVSHFWAFPVIDYADGNVKVLEITQKTIQGAIHSYVKNDEWGDPVQNYSFSVSKEGEKFETKYTVMANPAKGLREGYLETWETAIKDGFDMERIFSGGDPFTASDT